MSKKNIESHHNNPKEDKNYQFARWMSWIFLGASIFLLIYTYYRAEITNREAVGSMYLKYYLIALIGIFFWGFVLRLNAILRANLVTVCISLLVCIYLLEGALNLFAKSTQKTFNPFIFESSVEYDQRSKLEVIEDLILMGEDAVPSKGSSYKANKDELFPLSGVSHKKTVGGNETGQYMIYQSDRYGFNNPDFEWDAKDIEWLLIGDSFVFGEGLQSGENFADQIRLLSEENVINLGAGGNGPLMELAALTEYAAEVKPKKVIWFYYEGNDLIHDLPRDKSNQLLMKYMEDGFSQNLINQQDEVDKVLKKRISIEKTKAKKKSNSIRQKKVQKYQWVKLYAIRNMIGFDAYIEIDPLFSKILKKAKEKVESWGGEIYFVYLPEFNRYNVVRFSHDRFRKKSEMIGMVEELDIHVVDIHKEVFSKNPDPLSIFPLRRPGHYSAKAYAEVSRVVESKIKEFENNNIK
ncbi:hypothetical protein N9C88_03840 [Candidatus Pseudothioglobus singularis]|nr:hypothetical protein [Candidatus Pseudothioglobus singularis]